MPNPEPQLLTHPEEAGPETEQTSNDSEPPRMRSETDGTGPRGTGAGSEAPGTGSEQTRTSPMPTWEELYEQLGDRVFRYVYRMTRDAALAADLTHDTFVRVHERAHHYTGAGSIRAWVFQIAANKVRDDARRRSTRWKGLRLLRRRPGQSRLGPAHGAVALSVRRALDELPETQRVVLLLHDLDGLTHDEIGVALGIPDGTSKARLSRARAAMRRILTINEEPR